MRHLIACLIVLAGLFPVCIHADPTAGVSSGFCGPYSSTGSIIAITGANTQTPGCGWFQNNLGLAGTAFTSQANANEVPGTAICLPDPSISPVVNVMVTSPDAASGSVASNAQLAQWNLKTNTVTAESVIMQDAVATNLGHEGASCIGLPFGEALATYGAYSASGVNNWTVTTSVSSVAAGTAFPFSITITAGAAGMIAGQAVYVNAPHTQPNPRCTKAGSCEVWVIQSCTGGCGASATAITFTNFPGSGPQTEFTHAAGTTIETGNNTGSQWACANNNATNTCQPGKYIGVRDTPSTVQSKSELMFPDLGGIGQFYSARNGNQVIMCGEGLGGSQVPPSARNCLIYQGVSAGVGWFVANCETNAGCAANLVSADCAGDAGHACYNPFTDSPALDVASANYPNGSLNIGNTPIDNHYFELQQSGTVTAGANTVTGLHINGNTGCNVTWTSAGGAFSTADAVLWQAAFNANSACTSIAGNSYTAVYPLLHSDCTSSCLTLNTRIGIECNGPCDQSNLVTAATGTVTSCWSGGTCTPTVSLGNTGHIRNGGNGSLQYYPSISKYVMILAPDQYNFTWFQSGVGVNAGGYTLEGVETSGTVAIDGSNNPAITFTDLNGGNSLSRSITLARQCSNLSACATIANHSILGMGTDWTGNVPDTTMTDVFCSSGSCTPGTTAGTTVYTIPSPSDMLSLGLQPWIYAGAAEANYSTSDAVNLTAPTCSANPCTGTVTISGLAAGTVGYAGEILAFDCNSSGASPCEEAVIQSVSPAGASPTSFVVTLVNSHVNASMTVVGHKRPMQTGSEHGNCAANPLPNTSNFMIVCSVDQITGGQGVLNNAIYAFIYNPVAHTSTSDNVIQKATGGSQNQISALAISNTGVMSLTTTLGKCSDWAGSGLGTCLGRWTLNPPYTGSWSAGTFTTALGQTTQTGPNGDCFVGGNVNFAQVTDLCTLVSTPQSTNWVTLNGYMWPLP